METGKIEAIIAPSLEAMGYRVVRVTITGGRRATLQIMAERTDDAAMTVEDCADISRTVSALLDVADPIDAAYVLEVSSPGIDRPLTRLKDYADWAGHETRITLAEPREGRKQFSGDLQGIDGEIVKLHGKDGQDYGLPFADISSAKLVLTDKLIQATAPLSTEGADTIENVED